MASDEPDVDVGIQVIRSWTPEPKSLLAEVKTTNYFPRAEHVDVEDVEAVVHVPVLEPVPVPVVNENCGRDSPWVTIARSQKAVVLVSLFLGLFLSTLDTSIVATSLVIILTDFDDFAKSPWAILAYLLTYMCFAMAFARLSDVYGRKTLAMAAWIIFTAFSIGCGLARSMVELIIFRAFQGIGGSGLFSMTMVLISEVVSPEKMGLTSGMVGMTLGCSGVLGPILGGVISHFTMWRWIFLINIPLGCLAIASILIVWPKTPGMSLSSWVAFLSIDLFGIVLILAASGLHIYGFESAGTRVYDWSSPLIISILAVAAACWVIFVIWEFFLASKGSKVKPIFPFRIVRERVMASAILSAFLTGFPFIVSVITLPERFQIVNGASSLMAGVYLLPLLGASAVGSYLGGAISSKRNFTPYTLIASTILQLVGVGLLSTIGYNASVTPRQYLFEAILGLGIGLSLSTTSIMGSVQAKRGDLAAAQGAIAQVRVLGGIIGLTIATTLFNRRTAMTLSSYLTPSQLNALYESPLAALSFPPAQHDFVQETYASVFSQQMRVLVYIGLVAVVVSIFSWERRPLDMKKGMQAHRDGPGPESGLASQGKGTCQS